jgi:hypothetical protein
MATDAARRSCFMPGLQVKGTGDWARYSLTLTVPARSDRMRVARGHGTVWLDDVELESLGGG